MRFLVSQINYNIMDNIIKITASSYPMTGVDYKLIKCFKFSFDVDPFVFIVCAKKVYERCRAWNI